MLAQADFEFETKPYALFAAHKKTAKVNVVVYEKGPKVVVQGKGTAEFVEFVLEPQVIGAAEQGYEEVLQPEQFSTHIGIDESGKGDLFGPLVVAGVYVNREIVLQLKELGVMDSKKISGDKRILELAEGIKAIPGLAWDVLILKPERYNELYQSFRNLNRLLAWGHARVIENLLEQRPDCPFALSDQFANPKVLQAALMERGKKIELRQRTKAEADPAVAAASILAREKFVWWLRETGKRLGYTLQKGVSAEVKKTARLFLEQKGAEEFPKLAKMHFRTAFEVLGLPVPKKVVFNFKK